MHKYAQKLAFHKIFCSLPAKNNYKKTLSTIFAIFISIIAATIFIGIIGYDPKDFLHRLFTRWVGSYEIYLNKVAVVGIAALSFIFAYKAGLFNIGISGQMIGAGLVMIVVVRHMQISHLNVPNGVGQLLLFLVAVVSGALVTIFIGVLKIFLKINEVVSSIILNWVIYFIAKYTILKANNGLYAQNTTVPQGSVNIQWNFALNGLVPGYGYLFALGIFIILAIAVFILLKFTVFGQKILSVGRSFNASKYAGYKTRIIAISTFAISGMLAGVLGFVLYTANSQGQAVAVKDNVDILPNEGYDGIAIGLISLAHPLAAIPIAFFVGLLQFGADYLGGAFPAEVSGLIISFIMIGAAMFILFEKITPIYYIIRWVYGKKGLDDYKNYENKLNGIISSYNGLYVRHKKAYKDALNNIKTRVKNTNVDKIKLQLLIKLVHQYYGLILDQAYNEYVQATKINYQQLQKHWLMQSVNKAFFPEQRALHKAKLFYQRISLKHAKKIASLRDKLLLDKETMLRNALNFFKHHAKEIGFDYNEYLMYVRRNHYEIWSVNAENLADFKHIFLDSKFTEIADQKEITSENWEKLQTMINVDEFLSHFDPEIKSIYEILTHKQKISHEEWLRVGAYLKGRNKQFRTIFTLYVKTYKQYEKLLDQNNDFISAAKRYMSDHLRLPKQQSIKRAYKFSLRRVEKIGLEASQNSLLLIWLKTSYDQALEADKTKIIAKAVI
ncbi:ABC transporter permease [Ureaplasma zalophigenitalium]|uniref:ABC transporter permease n=1 Tax=Ureaplasma zalophigenitalium TaxID=907723 RepID=A0ABT3BNJ7_9BACT|nr:ABC transporter permease [Ureaplasma zalophigenitalium]MCV3753836.1 ABC transporter permease [Ureaplasma zalophigenitalium]